MMGKIYLARKQNVTGIMHLNVFSPLNFLGVGQHSYELIKQFHLLGHTVAWFPTFNQIERQDAFTKIWLDNRKWYKKTQASLFIFHDSYANQFRGCPAVAFSVFETDKLSDLDVSMLRSCDKILTPSAWAQGVLKNHMISSEVVPEGVDLDFYKPVNKPLGEVLRFGHVGKWEKRKGSEEIVRCFITAAQQSKCPVELLMHSHNPFLDEKTFVQFVGRACVPHPVAVTPQNLEIQYQNWKILIPRSRMASREEIKQKVYDPCDFGLFCSRGEAWQLGLIEMMAQGIPTLTTCVTGMSEYTGTYPDELKLKKSTLVPASDGIWFVGPRGNWVDPNESEIVEKLLDMMNRPAYYQAMSQACRKSVEQFSWTGAAQKLEAALHV